MKSLHFLSCLSLIGGVALATILPSKRQGTNLEYQGNESVMTAAYNVTYHMLPISRTDAMKLAGGRSLLPPTGFPAGYLKADEHVLFLSDGYYTDIRQLDLRVDALKTTVVQIPFVDGLKDGKTAFRLSAYTYQDQVVPALVGSITQGFPIIPATFTPKDAPYSSIGSGQYASSVFTGVDNTVPVLGGPGLLAPLFQANFVKTNSFKIPVSTYESITKQPLLHPDYNTCSNETIIFDNLEAQPFHIKSSSVQTYPPTTPSDYNLSGTEGYSLTVQWISGAGLGSPCSTFASS